MAVGRESLYPLNRLVAMYERSVGRKSTLILGITPDTRGLLPETDVRRLTEFGTTIRQRFGSPDASTSGSGYEIPMQLGAPKSLDRVMLQEEISSGERVREFRIDAFVDGQWQSVADGSCIGHKRIQSITPVTTTKLRLVITEATANPQIRNFAAFAVQDGG